MLKKSLRCYCVTRVLVKISDDLVFHRDALLDLRKRMSSEKTKSPKIDVARFKDLTGVSRKYAIPLLEYLDREHVTRRVGNERLILYVDAERRAHPSGRSERVLQIVRPGDPCHGLLGFKNRRPYNRKRNFRSA